MNQPIASEMTIRRITLADGRYMIFYTFSKETPEPHEETVPNREKESSRQTERGSRV